MTKNISVVDAQGNVYASTYPRRARGLVKKGRACFVNESVICLACPPFQMEDNKVDTIYIKEQLQDADSREVLKETDIDNGQTDMGIKADKNADTSSLPAAAKSGEMEQQQPLDSAYLIQKIDQIIAESGYLTTALSQLEKLDKEGAAAACNMIAYREQTNQRMIDFLEKLMGKLAV